MAQLAWSEAPDVGSPRELKQFLDDLLKLLKDYQTIGNGIIVLAGSGTPEGAKTANVGSVYLRTDGGTSTTIYIKESGTGSAGWRAL